MGFPRHKYWSALTFPSPGDLPNPGIKPTSPALAGRSLTTKQEIWYISSCDLVHYVWIKNTADLQRRWWHPTPVLLPGKSHGRRSLVGCHPWGREESDMTEWLHFHFSPSRIGEGNGNPLQCSCLENPRDRGAWWAAVYGVAQSQTRLKWLSSSSSSWLESFLKTFSKIFEYFT